MNQPETTQWLIMKPQIYFISICLAMVFVISSDLAFAGLNATVEPADEVTYTDASSSDISEISDGIKNWVTKTFAGERTIKSLDVDAIIYTSPTMERVFIPGSYYVRMTINGDKLPGTVMCRTTTGMEMLPDRRRVPIDIVTPQHIIEGFRITTEEDAIFFHKALEHFIGSDLADIEDLPAERGVTVSYESIRLWCIKFGALYARRMKRKRPCGRRNENPAIVPGSFY
jgi:hypothetical protein